MLARRPVERGDAVRGLFDVVAVTGEFGPDLARGDGIVLDDKYAGHAEE